MKKCRYCGKELDSNLEFCSSECENSYRKIIEKDRHKIKYFIPGLKYGMMISGLALVVLIFWEKIRKYKRKQVRKYKRKK